MWSKIPRKLHKNEKKLDREGAEVHGAPGPPVKIEITKQCTKINALFFLEGTDAYPLVLLYLHNILKWHAL